MAQSESDPIATGTCGYCKAKINYRATHTGLVFFTCRGEHSTTQCRRREFMGLHESREFLAKIEAMKEETANDNEKPSGPVEPEKPAEKPERNQSSTGEKRTGTGGSDGWSVDF